jgi:ADP-ribose pyrophosphatase
MAAIQLPLPLRHGKNAMPYELIQSRKIHQGKVFSLRQDEIRLPNGEVSRLDIVDHPGAVVLLPVQEDGQILFIRQYRHSAGEEMLELPAGTLESGETAEACALREIREEIGMSAGEIEKVGEFFLAPGYSTELLYLYLARDLRPDPLPGDSDEFIQVEPLPLEQAYSMAESGQIRDGKTLAALILAQNRLHK